MHDIDCDPEQMLGDKGYDSEAIRQDIAERGGQAVIPSIASRKIQHTIDKALYALRNRIERFFNRAKNSRRVATRYDKLIESFAAFVLLASIRIWIKFVHTRLASDGTCGRYGETCGGRCGAAGLQSTSVPASLARSGGATGRRRRSLIDQPIPQFYTSSWEFAGRQVFL